MKKLLAIFLTAVMLTLAVSSAIPAFATGSDKPFTVGTETYATLKEAVAAAKEGSIDTIVVTADYTTEYAPDIPAVPPTEEIPDDPTTEENEYVPANPGSEAIPGTPATDIDIVVDFPLTIKSAEGQRYTLNFTPPGDHLKFWITATANLTIENLNLNTTQGIKVTGAELNIKNSVINSYTERTTAANENGSMALFRLDSVKATFDNVTATHEVNHLGKDINIGASTIFVKGNGSVLDFKNNTTITEKSTTTIKNGSAYLIFADFENCTKVEDGKNFTLNLGAGCSLVNETVMGSVGHRPSGIVWFRKFTDIGSDATKIAINLAEGSVIGFNTALVTYETGGKKYTPQILYGVPAGCVTDNGCEYRLYAPYTKSAVGTTVYDSNLIYFPNIINPEGDKKFYGYSYKLDEEGQQTDKKYDIAVENGGKFQMDEKTYYIFKFSIPEIPAVLTNGEGASIRTDAPYGIRFYTKVNTESYERMMAKEEIKSITFGMIVTSEEVYFSNSFFDSYSSYTNGVEYIAKEFTIDQIDEDGTFSVSAYIKGDPMTDKNGADALTTTYSACSYYKVEYTDGSSAYIFSDFDATESARSFYDVAKAYKEANLPDNALINGIVSKIDG